MMALHLKIFVIGISILLLGVSIYLVFQNRSSEVIVTSFFTMILIGSVGILVTTTFSFREKVEEKTLVKSFVFQKVDKLPIDDPTKSYLRPIMGRDFQFIPDLMVSKAIEKNPKLIEMDGNKTDGDCVNEGTKLYQEILYSQIVSVLMRYCDWDSQAQRLKGLGSSRVTQSVNLDDSRNKTDFGTEFFIRLSNINYFDEIDKASKLSAPKGTKISGDSKHLNIKSSLVDLTISVSPMGGSIGSGAFYNLMGLSPFENLKYWTANYKINMRAKYNPIKPGHPEMKKTFAWINNIFKEMDYFFNSESQLEESLQLFNLTKDFKKINREDYLDANERYYEWFESQKKINRR